MTRHSTFVDIAGKFCLANDDDPFYAQEFTNAAEYFAFIEQLIADGNKHFGTSYQICANNGCMNVDYADGEHASDFAISRTLWIDGEVVPYGSERWHQVISAIEAGK